MLLAHLRLRWFGTNLEPHRPVDQADFHMRPVTGEARLDPTSGDCGSTNRSPNIVVAMRLSPGQELAHYEVIELIGEGGMGAVYRALDTKLGR